MKRRIALTVIGVGGMAALTVMQFVPTYEHAQFVVLCLSVTALVLGLGDVNLTAKSLVPRNAFVYPYLYLALMTVLAFGVRAWRLTHNMRALVDEVNSFAPLISLWVYEGVPLLARMNTSVIPYSWLYSYLQNGFVALLGNNFWGLRGLALVGGALTVPAVYALARTFHEDRRVAWVAALMTAGFPLAIHYSRLAIHNALDPLVGALAFLFLARGWKHNRPLDWVLGGVWLGLTHYFWEGGRLFNTSFVLLWFVWLALNHRDQARRVWRGLASAAFAMLVMIVPLYVTWALTETGTESRLERSGLDSDFLADLLLATPDSEVLQAYLQEFANAFLVLFAIPESSRFYGGDYPFLLYFVSPFALVGLIWCLRRARTLAGIPAWWVLAVPAANGLLLEDTYGSPRFLNLIPVLPLLIAIGVVWIADRFPARWRNVTAAVLALGLFAGQVGYYYGVHLPRFQVEVRDGDGDLDDATIRAAELPLDALAVIVTKGERDSGHPDKFMRYLYGNDPYPQIGTMLSEIFIAEMQVPDVLDHLPSGGYAFFILPDDTAAQRALQGRFGNLEPLQTPYPVPLDTAYLMYRVLSP